VPENTLIYNYKKEDTMAHYQDTHPPCGTLGVVRVFPDIDRGPCVVIPGGVHLIDQAMLDYCAREGQSPIVQWECVKDFTPHVLPNTTRIDLKTRYRREP
jgi:hypothetical protein